MLVRFNKRTIVGGTIYTPEDGDVELANDLADQVVAEGNGVVVGLGENYVEARLATDANGNTVLVGPDGVHISIAGNTAADMYSVMSKGQMAFDWRGTLSGVGFTLDTTSICPTGAGVVALNGEGTTDTIGNVQNNQCTTTLGSPISTANTSSFLIYARVPRRNSARKNYRNCPLSVLLSVDAVFTKYLTFVFNAVADGKWHAYSLDLYNPSANNGAFTVGVDSIDTARIRPAISNSAADTGTSQLQVGEKAYYGAIVSNPRAKAMAIIRFDDSLSSLYSRKACVVSTQFNGVSGVTVPVGNYSIYELVSLFGHVGTCFLLSGKFGSTYSNYETVENLLAMQTAGWEMCWQTHSNPLQTEGLGARLLGAAGHPWVAEQTISHTAAGVITYVGHKFVRTYGQTSKISPIGTPPSPLAVGETYYAYPINADTFSLHYTESDAYNNANAITFSSSGTATWGWNFPGAAADASGIDAEFSAGKSAMIAAGMKGWRHWAPNQGACTGQLEDAWYANGMTTMWPIDLDVYGSVLGNGNHYDSVVGNGNMTLQPGLITTRSCALLDSITEAQARAYVQKICKYGGIGQGLLHEPSGPSTIALMGYLDELKLRQDAGEIEVATPTRVKAYLDAIRY